MMVGERANTMARLFNNREGFTTADDALPDRLFEPLESGKLAGVSILDAHLRWISFLRSFQFLTITRLALFSSIMWITICLSKTGGLDNLGLRWVGVERPD
jgi:hypothetical protein